MWGFHLVGNLHKEDVRKLTDDSIYPKQLFQGPPFPQHSEPQLHSYRTTPGHLHLQGPVSLGAVPKLERGLSLQPPRWAILRHLHFVGLQKSHLNVTTLRFSSVLCMCYVWLGKGYTGEFSASNAQKSVLDALELELHICVSLTM